MRRGYIKLISFIFIFFIVINIPALINIGGCEKVEPPKVVDLVATEYETVPKGIVGLEATVEGAGAGEWEASGGEFYDDYGPRNNVWVAPEAEGEYQIFFRAVKEGVGSREKKEVTIKRKPHIAFRHQSNYFQFIGYVTLKPGVSLPYVNADSWSIEYLPLDSKYAFRPTIKVGSGGKPIIVAHTGDYFKSTLVLNKIHYGIKNGMIKYAFKIGGSWNFEDIDNIGTYSIEVPIPSNWTDEDVDKYLASQVIGVPVSFYLDASNNPVVTFYNDETKSLYLTKKNTLTGAWEKQMIDAGLDTDSIAIDVSASMKARVVYNNKYLATECQNVVEKTEVMYFQEENRNFIGAPTFGGQCYAERFKTADIAETNLNNFIKNDMGNFSFSKEPLQTYGFDFTRIFLTAFLKGSIIFDDGIMAIQGIPGFIQRIEIDRIKDSQLENKSITLYYNYESKDNPQNDYVKIDVRYNQIKCNNNEDCQIGPHLMWTLLYNGLKSSCSPGTSGPDCPLLCPSGMSDEECKTIVKNYLLQNIGSALNCVAPVVVGEEAPPIYEGAAYYWCTASPETCVGFLSTAPLVGVFFSPILVPFSLLPLLFSHYNLYIDTIYNEMGDSNPDDDTIIDGFDFTLYGSGSDAGKFTLTINIPKIHVYGQTSTEILGINWLEVSLFHYGPDLSGRAEIDLTPTVTKEGITFRVSDVRFNVESFSANCTGVCSWFDSIQNDLKDEMVDSFKKTLKSNRAFPELFGKAVEEAFWNANPGLNRSSDRLESVIITDGNIRYFYRDNP